MNEPGKNESFVSDYAGPSLDKLLNGSRAGFIKSTTIQPGDLFPMYAFQGKSAESRRFFGPVVRGEFKEDFTIRINRPTYGRNRKRAADAARWGHRSRSLLTGPNLLYKSTNEPATVKAA